MNFRTRISRILAGLIGAAGLAYPACAAICPKGHGSCPYPGKCFLYMDADSNSICDYTQSTSPTSPPQNPAVPSATTGPASATGTVPADGNTPAASSVTAYADSAGRIFQHDALLIGGVLFVILFVVVYHLIRSGRCGICIRKTGPALAFAVLISLPVSGITTYLLLGDAASGSGSYFAAIYLVAGMILTAYLWKSGVVTRRIVLAAAAVSMVFGFVLSVLIMPAEFYGIAGSMTGSQTLTFGIIVLLAALALSIIAGRTFCGHICPVGSIQELAFCMPVYKYTVQNTRILEGIRVALFGAAVLAALYGVDLLSSTGAYDLFSLTLSTGSIVFAGLLIISVIVYRPVCRALCPFGFLFSLVSHFSWSRLERTGACISCGKCEKICPAQVAKIRISQRECYLCARCTDTCPAGGALVFR